MYDAVSKLRTLECSKIKLANTILKLKTKNIADTCVT